MATLDNIDDLFAANNIAQTSPAYDYVGPATMLGEIQKRTSGPRLEAITAMVMHSNETLNSEPNSLDKLAYALYKLTKIEGFKKAVAGLRNVPTESTKEVARVHKLLESIETAFGRGEECPTPKCASILLMNAILPSSREPHGNKNFGALKELGKDLEALAGYAAMTAEEGGKPLFLSSHLGASENDTGTVEDRENRLMGITARVLGKACEASGVLDALAEYFGADAKVSSDYSFRLPPSINTNKVAI